MTDHVIASLSKTADGAYLIASSDSPRFCFKAPTEQEAVSKALKALRYFAEAKKTVSRSPRETRVISPIYAEVELCA